MKKTTSTSSVYRILFFILGILSLTFSSCIREEDEKITPSPGAYVSLYHGSPDAPDLDIYLDNQRINSQGFKYTTFSDYLSFTPGTRTIKFTPLNAVNAFIDTTLTFKADNVYSLFAINRIQSMELLVVKDSIRTLGTGKAGIRIAHLSPDAPAVDIYTSSATSTPLAAHLHFKGVSLFTDLPAGTQTLQVKKAGTNEVLLTVSNQVFESGKTYSLLIRGFMTPPAGNTNILSGQLIHNY